MIAELLTGCVTVALGGRERRVLFTHRVLLEVERLTGLNILAGALDLQRCSAGELRCVLSAVLDMPLVETGAMITAARMPRIRAALLAGWSASMPDRAELSDKPPGKPPSWPEAWARARGMGLSDPEWLDTTPRLLHAVAVEHLARLRDQEFMQSRLIAVVANFSMAAPKEPIPEDHFMLHPWPKEPPKPMTGEDLMQQMARYRQRPIIQGKPFA